MKKYLLPFVVVLVAVSMSAFTARKSYSHSTQELYWYIVNGSNQSVANDQVNSDPMTAQEAIDDALIPCAGNTSVDCARGFVNPLPSNTTAAGDEQIKKN